MLVVAAVVMQKLSDGGHEVGASRCLDMPDTGSGKAIGRNLPSWISSRDTDKKSESKEPCYDEKGKQQGKPHAKHASTSSESSEAAKKSSKLLAFYLKLKQGFEYIFMEFKCSPAPKKATKEVERIDNFFASYANTSTGMIDPEGVEKLCSDLAVEHTDVRILMLAWKMYAKKQGYFTQVAKPENFEGFYCYSFRYCLTEDKQKSLDIESVCVLLDLVLGSNF